MDFGSIKNVGIAAVEAIVKIRNLEGEYKSFVDFLEKIAGESVNKKCIESLIKAGAFDEFGHTRATLLASFDVMVDTAQQERKKEESGQISFFDLGTDDEQEKMQKIKYRYVEYAEMKENEMLSLEKEMLGIYLTNHPLESFRQQIESEKNKIVYTRQLNDIESENEANLIDGQNIKIIGIINSINKKYTKTNKLLVTFKIEDLCGTKEVVMFEAAYIKSADVLREEAIVMLDARINIKEDGISIFANKLEQYILREEKIVIIDINNLDTLTKDQLRNSIKHYAMDKILNTDISVKIGDEIKSCGRIYTDVTRETIFKHLVGDENIQISKI